jgi:serine/threonine protein kinase
MARVGQTLDERFELLELLGHGGMGAVYKARHLLMDRMVAVKMLLQDVADDPAINDRFKREAKAAGRVNHPNVVQLIDYGQGPEGAYIVVEYIDGIGLDGLLKRDGALPPAKAVHIFEQICEGVGKAHAKGIVHRDLKPSNVMLCNEEGDPYFVKIVDFGLAKAMDPGEESQKLTQSGDIFGSPVYMSPQQCLGHAADPRSDIYAMGVLMYETLTGKVPLLGANVGETIAKQLQETPKSFAEMRPDLQIPASLEQVVFKALEKDPENRQPSMMELKEELIDAMLPKLQAKKKTTTVLVKPSLAPPPGGGSKAPTPVASDVTTRVMNSADLNFDTRLRSNDTVQTTQSVPLNAVKSPVNFLLIAVLVMLVACAGLLAANMFMKQPACEIPSKAGVKPAVSSHDSILDSSHSSSGNSGNTGNSGTFVYAEHNLQKHSNPEHQHILKKIVNEIRTQELIENAPKPHIVSGLKNKVRQIKNLVKANRSEQGSQSAAGSSSPTVNTEANNNNNYVPRHKKHSADWNDFSYRYEKKGDFTTNWQPPVAGSK